MHAATRDRRPVPFEVGDIERRYCCMTVVPRLKTRTAVSLHSLCDLKTRHTGRSKRKEERYEERMEEIGNMEVNKKERKAGLTTLYAPAEING
jgi:hypothetical protein